MGLLSKLKSLLGGGSSSPSRDRNVDITLEREGATEPDTESEEAVKEPVADEDAEPVAEGGDAAASTESLVEDSVEAGDADPAEHAEPAEASAAQPSEDDMSTDIPEAESAESVDEPIAEETEAAASTESLVEDSVEAGDADPAEHAEPAEASAAQPSEGDMTVDVEDAEPDDGDDVADTASAADVELLKGIGPAYADRLREAGVETVGDLADADVDELADSIDLSPKRVGRWQERARDRLDE